MAGAQGTSDMVSEGLKRWRRRQKKGAIMEPETFHKIEASERAKGLSEERAERAAGKAYWRVAKSKYTRAMKRKRKKG